MAKRRSVNIVAAQITGAAIVLASLIAAVAQWSSTRRSSDPLYDEVPRIRTTYYRFEGTLLLDRAIRGYGFSKEEGFHLRPDWYQNRVFKDVESILSLNRRPQRSQGTMPYDLMSLSAIRQAGVVHHEHYDYTNEATARYSNSLMPFRGFSAFSSASGLEDYLRRVHTEPGWTIRVQPNVFRRAPEEPVWPFSWFVFGLPTRAEAKRFSGDPISMRLLSSNPTTRGLVFMSLFGSPHDGRYSTYAHLREIKLLVLSLENIGNKPIGLGSMRTRELRPRDRFEVRTLGEHNAALESTRPREHALPLDILLPRESLFVPLQIEAGLATATREGQNYDAESLLFEEDFETEDWWSRFPGESVELQVLQGLDADDNWVTRTVSVKKRVLDDKPALEELVERVFLFGSAARVESIGLLTGNGKELTYEIRDFDPENLIARGGYEKGSCPVLFAQGTRGWRRLRPVLTDAIGRDYEMTDTVDVSAGKSFLLREEEPEVSYLDRVSLVIHTGFGELEAFPFSMPELLVRDGYYKELAEGEEVVLKFDIPEDYVGSKATLEITGYYVPDSVPRVATDGATRQ